MWSRPRPARRALCLTFDDGPSQWTEALLDLFAEHDAHATFFVIGAAVDGSEERLRRAAAEGHELGNHTYTHRAPRALSDDDLRDELIRAGDRIRSVLGYAPKVVRPPYFDDARRFARVARGLGLGPTVLGSVDPRDWAESSPDVIASHVLSHAEPGAIVDLHDGIPPASRGTDSRQPTVEAMAVVVPALRERGFALVTVSELLA